MTSLGDCVERVGYGRLFGSALRSLEGGWAELTDEFDSSPGRAHRSCTQTPTLLIFNMVSLRISQSTLSDLCLGSLTGRDCLM